MSKKNKEIIGWAVVILASLSLTGCGIWQTPEEMRTRKELCEEFGLGFKYESNLFGDQRIVCVNSAK